MTLYEELVARGIIAQVTSEEVISKMINEGKATFYIGFDPTADSLHVGHFIQLLFMKRLQQLGNKPIVLVGGGTGMIGDPSDRTDMRKVMTVDTIDSYCESMKKQVEKFIDFSDGKALMVNNAQWLRDIKWLDILREIGPYFSINRMLAAECYKSRLDKGLSFLEFNYMVLQGYDFYELYLRYGCNLQFGGNDQWSNLLGGTELIRRKLGVDAHVLTTTLLLNSEGAKMGKTAKGALWLDPAKTTPFEFYQYWRNIEDERVIGAIKMLTFIPLEEIKIMESWEGKQLNLAKEILAYDLTKAIHGEDVAKDVQNTVRELFSLGGAADMPSVELGDDDFINGEINILTLLQKSGLCQTRSDARRAVDQGGVELSGIKVSSIEKNLSLDDCSGDGVIIRRGKKNYCRVYRQQ